MYLNLYRYEFVTAVLQYQYFGGIANRSNQVKTLSRESDGTYQNKHFQSRILQLLYLLGIPTQFSILWPPNSLSRFEFYLGGNPSTRVSIRRGIVIKCERLEQRWFCVMNKWIPTLFFGSGKRLLRKTGFDIRNRTIFLRWKMAIINGSLVEIWICQSSWEIEAYITCVVNMNYSVFSDQFVIEKLISSFEYVSMYYSAT